MKIAHFGFSKKELNTLIAACMLSSIVYEEKAKGKPPPIPSLGKDLCLKSAEEYRQLETKLRIYLGQMDTP